MNNIFLVLTSLISPLGCLRLPVKLTREFVPSIILSKACCTPSPLTSLVILADSLRREILSISSMKIIPCSALLMSPFAAFNNRCISVSTSSPTYPDSVILVASAIANGTFKYF